MIQNAATDVTTGWREIALDVLTTCGDRVGWEPWSFWVEGDGLGWAGLVGGEGEVRKGTGWSEQEKIFSNPNKRSRIGVSAECAECAECAVGAIRMRSGQTECAEECRRVYEREQPNSKNTKLSMLTGQTSQ